MNLTAPERYRRMDESCGSMAEPQSRDELIKIPVGYKKKRKSPGCCKGFTDRVARMAGQCYHR